MNYFTNPYFQERRYLVYSILYKIFFENPHPQFLEEIIKEELFLEFPLNIDHAFFLKGLTELKDWSLKSKEEDANQLQRTLQKDYNDLFIGPGSLLAPPWESVYTTAEKLVFDKPTFKVREFYQRHDLEFIKKNKEPDDHFGLEMAFMAHLIQKQEEARSAGNDQSFNYYLKEQLTFLEEHILAWLDPFTSDIIEHATTSYYQGIAKLSKGFIHWDYQFFKTN